MDSAANKIGWVLRTNRQLASREEPTSVRSFAAKFRPSTASSPLSPSQLTRWETGVSTVDDLIIERYESLLGLQKHSLAITCEAAARYLSVQIRSAKTAKARTNGHGVSIHELLQKALTPGHMSTSDWRSLTNQIRLAPGLVLHPDRLWSPLIRNLLEELAAAQHGAWLARQEAMSRLLEHPVAGPYAVNICIEVAEDPANPACIEPISLLDASALPTANNYVLQQLQDPASNKALTGALLACSAKLGRGHFSAADVGRLRIYVSELYPLLDHSTIGPLIRSFAPAKCRDTRSRSSNNDRMLAQQLALNAHGRAGNPSLEADATFVQLIHEAIYGANPDGRLYAASLISATPYRQLLAETIMRELTKPNSAIRLQHIGSALSLLTRLGGSWHRPVIGTLLTGRGLSPDTRNSIVWACAHSAGRFTVQTWRKILDHQLALSSIHPSKLDSDIVRGIIYCIGTDGHHRLLADLTADDRLPSDARLLAQWWQRRPVSGLLR